MHAFSTLASIPGRTDYQHAHKPNFIQSFKYEIVICSWPKWSKWGTRWRWCKGSSGEARGIPGKRGIAGRTGQPGKPGPVGLSGTPGINGVPGRNASDGERGDKVQK